MSFYSELYEIEKTIKELTDPIYLTRIDREIDETIEKLKVIKTTIPKRIEHVNNNIVKKYFISVFKTKGEYRDTYRSGEVINDGEKINGVHYSISVHEYVFDKSLIGSKEKHSDNPVTVPYVRSAYHYGYSKCFSWKKKELAIQYAQGLADQFGITLYNKKAAPSGAMIYEDVLLASGSNSPWGVWHNKFLEDN